MQIYIQKLVCIYLFAFYTKFYLQMHRHGNSHFHSYFTFQAYNTDDIQLISQNSSKISKTPHFCMIPLTTALSIIAIYLYFNALYALLKCVVCIIP